MQDWRVQLGAFTSITAIILGFIWGYSHVGVHGDSTPLLTWFSLIIAVVVPSILSAVKSAEVKTVADQTQVKVDHVITQAAEARTAAVTAAARAAEVAHAVGVIRTQTNSTTDSRDATAVNSLARTASKIDQIILEASAAKTAADAASDKASALAASVQKIEDQTNGGLDRKFAALAKENAALNEKIVRTLALVERVADVVLLPPSPSAPQASAPEGSP